MVESRSQVRRQAILRAGKAVFLEHGYTGASVDEVVRRAECSKRTVYKYFGNKEELFAEIVASLVEQMMEPLRLAPEASGDVVETLVSLGQTYLQVLLREDALAIFRTVVAEAQRFPALTQTFFDSGPGAVAARLAVYLRTQAQVGALQVDDPETAARQLLGMLRSDLHMRAALGLDLPSSQRVENEVRRAVTVFVSEYRA